MALWPFIIPEKLEIMRISFLSPESPLMLPWTLAAISAVETFFVATSKLIPF